LRQAAPVTELVLAHRAGACSHMPAPLANQSVRFRPVQPYTPAVASEPKWVTGTLRERPQIKSVFVVTGEVALRSLCALDDATALVARPGETWLPLRFK
jgi:hypothetical protein